MSFPQVPPVQQDATEQLSFTRSVRNMLVQKKIGENGDNIDNLSDKEVRNVLTALKDNDAQTLTQQRLQIENKAVDDAVQRAKEIIPHLYKLAPQQPAVDVTTIDPNTQPLPFTVPQDPNSQFQVVETMLEVGTSDESFTQFMDRTKPTKK